MTLVGKTISTSYKSLLRIDDDTNGVGTSLKQVTDGKGGDTSIHLSDDNIRVQPQVDNTNTTFLVRDKDSASVLTVDTVSKVVKVNANQDYANTQYAYFGASNIDTADMAAGYHYPVPFNSIGYGDLDNIPAFGNGPVPAVVFTTADANATRASDLVPCLWYVPDNITIDSITSIEGADTSGNDDTFMSLYSFTFNTGSTSALTAGAIHAVNTSSTNSGDEQAYKKVWSVISGDVNTGKVIVAFFEPVSINSDYSINITIKYHLR